MHEETKLDSIVEPDTVADESRSKTGLWKLKPGKPKTLYCSFCGKSQHEVKQLVAGPKVFICNECVKLCADLVEKAANRGEE